MEDGTTVKPADGKMQSLCDKLKPIVEERLGKELSSFTAVSYWSETASNGSFNYGIKVKVGSEHVHVFATQDSKGEIWLENCDEQKEADDIIL